jgi:esterase/lipase superfamily enzyme
MTDALFDRYAPQLIASEAQRDAKGLARHASALIAEIGEGGGALAGVVLDVARRLLDWGSAKQALALLNKLRVKVRTLALTTPHPSAIDDTAAQALVALGRRDEALKLRERIAANTKKETGKFSYKLAAELAEVLEERRLVGVSVAELDELDKEIVKCRKLAAASFDAMALARADGVRGKADITPDSFWLDDSYDEPDGLISRVVFFATNRRETGEEHPYRRFGPERSAELSYGRAVVTLPPGRNPGELPQTKNDWLRHKLLHVVVANLRVDTIEEFDASVRARLKISEERAGRSEAMVFVHGFRTPFAQALERTAQLAEDLRIDGAAVSFSWPSRGGLFDYWADREEATDKALEQLAGFLLHLKRDLQIETVHLIAHSMGCRFLTKALDKVAAQARGVEEIDRQPLFGHVIYAAPDLDHDDFPGPVERSQRTARQATLYQSRNDIALKASSYFNGGGRRAGDAETPIAYMAFDSIDASFVKSRRLGHDYLTVGAIEDVRALVWLNLSIQKREAAHLERFDIAGLPYYRYVSDRVPLLSRAIMHASFLVRGYGAGAADRLTEIVEAMSGELDLELAPLREATLALIQEVIPSSGPNDIAVEVA